MKPHKNDRKSVPTTSRTRPFLAALLVQRLGGESPEQASRSGEKQNYAWRIRNGFEERQSATARSGKYAGSGREEGKLTEVFLETLFEGNEMEMATEIEILYKNSLSWQIRSNLALVKIR